MNKQQIDLVGDTFALLKPQADEVARLFYKRLFELDPALRSMFDRSDMAAQRSKLMSMLAVAIDGLERLDVLGPTLRQLGARHVSHGVLDAHYETVGSALLDTLALGLGARFTSDVRAAWTSAYLQIAGAMQDGAAVESARRSLLNIVVHP